MAFLSSDFAQNEISQYTRLMKEYINLEQRMVEMNRTHIFLLGALLSWGATAGTMGQSDHSYAWQPLVDLSVGPAWSNSGETQTFYLQPDVEKTYTANKNIPAFVNWEVFLGGQHNLGVNYLGQLGIAVQGAGNATLSGDVWEDADPDFNNFIYSYNINHVAVALKGKLIGYPSFYVQPYISGSAGVGFNHSYAFAILPKISAEIPAPNFTNNTTTTFSYTLGIGLQKTFYTHYQIGVGYEFDDWGKSNLSAAPLQSENQGLSLQHLYAHQLQFTIGYIA